MFLEASNHTDREKEIRGVLLQPLACLHHSGSVWKWGDWGKGVREQRAAASKMGGGGDDMCIANRKAVGKQWEAADAS